MPSLVADRRDDSVELTPAMAAAVAEAVERPEIEEVVEMGRDRSSRTRRPDGRVKWFKRRLGTRCTGRGGRASYFDDITAGYALYPLIILFGLNAVDELDRTVFGVLGPEIRDAFGLTNQGYLDAHRAHAARRPAPRGPARLLRRPAATGRASRCSAPRCGPCSACSPDSSTTILMLVIARSGAGMGRAVVTPTHNSLLSDYYPIEVRADVFGFHRMANALGAFIGPLVGGLLAEAFGWRTPFFVFVFPTVVFVILGLRLREPGRGHFERAAGGAEAAVVQTDDAPPSWAESVRILWQVRTLRRIWYSLPFLAASVIGLASLTVALLRGGLQPLGVAARLRRRRSPSPPRSSASCSASRSPRASCCKDPGLGLRLLSFVAVGIAGAWIAFALGTRPLGRGRRQHR